MKKRVGEIKLPGRIIFENKKKLSNFIKMEVLAPFSKGLRSAAASSEAEFAKERGIFRRIQNGSEFLKKNC